MAYMGIIWRDLSIDLVAASLRQREFAKKITSDECHTLNSPVALSRAISRYLKFIDPPKETRSIRSAEKSTSCTHVGYRFMLAYSSIVSTILS